MSIEDNVGFGLERKGVAKGELKGRVAEMLELVGLVGLREAQAAAALGRPAAARRARAGAREPPARPAARRAARRARPEAPQADAAGAETDPERGRDHVRPRHARPGGGDDDGRHDRRHERRANRAARPARPSSTSARRRRSWPASSAPRTCSPARSRAPDAIRLDDGTLVRATRRRAHRDRSRPASGPRRSRSERRGRERACRHDLRDRVHRRRDAGGRANGGGNGARLRTEHGCGRARARTGNDCRTELGAGVRRSSSTGTPRRARRRDE